MTIELGIRKIIKCSKYVFNVLLPNYPMRLIEHLFLVDVYLKVNFAIYSLGSIFVYVIVFIFLKSAYHAC